MSEVVRATCEQIVTRRGLELVELSLGQEGRGQVLRVTVDDPAGSTSLDEVAEVSEEISRALDAQDPIPGRYTLEVSSAGLERPLVRPSDYHRFTGRQIKVRTLELIEGRRTFTGSIRSAGDDSFVLLEGPAGGGDGAPVEARGGVVEIPYVAVARARLVVDWESELRGRPKGSTPGVQRAPGDGFGSQDGPGRRAPGGGDGASFASYSDDGAPRGASGFAGSSAGMAGGAGAYGGPDVGRANGREGGER